MKDYSFGNYICALRTGLGLSQFQLGALVGVTDKAVSKWENGDAKPRLATCHRLAEVLGVSISQLLSCERIHGCAGKELDKMSNKLWKEAYRRLRIYGEAPPLECMTRLSSEEFALRDTDAVHCFAATGKMMEALKARGTAMTVRGGINASFTAWLFGATHVNPLPPHYRCPVCGDTRFVPDVADGFDLPVKKCGCGAEYIRDGHGLPFETYDDKLRSGTHLEFNTTEQSLPVAAKALLEFYDGKAELLPVKMHSSYDGQSVQRYVILPEHKARPELSEDGFWHIAMDDYWQWQEGETSFTFLISDQLTELEQSGLTFPDPMSLMTPRMAEKLFLRRCEKYAFFTDRLAPEEPHDFDLLLRIDSMSHSTGPWTGNGEVLVAQRSASLRQIPASRDHVWQMVNDALIRRGIYDSGFALTVMDTAKRGLFYSRGIPEDICSGLRALDLPEWFPGYLEKIVYLSPMGHCVAYLLTDALTEWVWEQTEGAEK